MIEVNDITKLEISPSYNFHSNKFIKTFIVDLENRKAYWEDKAYQPLSKTIEEARESNDTIYTDIIRSLTLTDYYFTPEKIASFKEKLLETGFISDLYNRQSNFIKKDYYDESLIDVFNSVKLAKMLYITIHTDTKKEHFTVNFDIPESYTEFAKLINSLIGYEILNPETDKHFVNQINYNSKSDGIYTKDVNNQLELKTITFNYSYKNKPESHGFILNFNSFEDELIDLVENNQIIWNDTVETLKNNRSYDLFIIENNNKHKKKLSEEEISKIRDLLIQNNVYLWTDKRLYINFIHNYENMPDEEYTWSLEMEFEGDIVYHVEVSDRHPDTYFQLGEDLKQLTGMDLLRLDDCNMF